MPAWELQRRADVVTIEPSGPLIVDVRSGVDLAVDATVAGCGVIHLFEDWLRPQVDSCALEPVLETLWRPSTGPGLHYPGCVLPHVPLRAYADFVQVQRFAV